METVVTAFNPGLALTLLGVASSVFIAGVGSSMAIRTAAQKGAGVLAEKPNVFGNVLALTALPGSQGLYGLLISIIILFKIGVIGGGEIVELSLTDGVKYLIAGLLMGFSGLTSAVLQGKAVAAALGALAKNETIGGKTIIMAALIETYAIFGFLIAVFL